MITTCPTTLMTATAALIALTAITAVIRCNDCTANIGRQRGCHGAFNDTRTTIGSVRWYGVLIRRTSWNHGLIGNILPTR